MLYSQIGKNVGFSFIGRSIGMVISIISFSFIARSLGASGFGEYSTVIAYLSIFQILADFGLGSLLTKEISQNPNREEQIISNFFTIRLFIAILFLAVASFLVVFFPYSSIVKIGVLFTSIAFLSMSLSQMMLSVMQAHFVVYKSVIAELAGRITTLVLVIALFYTTSDVLKFLYVFIIASLVIFIVNVYFVRKIAYFSININTKDWKKIVATSYPIAISIIFTFLYFKADTILLSIMKDAESVGFYNIAYRVLEAFLFFPAAFFGIVLPILSKNSANIDKMKKLLSYLVDLLLFATIPLVIGGFILSASILNFIGGEEFLQSTKTLQILFIAIGVIAFGNLFSSSIIAFGLQKKAIIAYAAGFIFNITANIIVIPKYSYEGVAMTTLLTEILVTAVLFKVIYKKSKFKISIKNTMTTIATSSIMTLALFIFISDITKPNTVTTMMLAIAMGAAIYLAINYRYIKKQISAAKEIVG